MGQVLKNTADGRLHRYSNGHYHPGITTAAEAKLYGSMYRMIISSPNRFGTFPDDVLQGAIDAGRDLVAGLYTGAKTIGFTGAASPPFHDNFYAHDSANKRINMFSNNIWFMQPDHNAPNAYVDPRGFTAANWAVWRGQDIWANADAENAKYPNDPINVGYLDSMSATVGIAGARPINWHTGLPYSVDEQRALNATVGDQALAFKGGVPGRLVIANGARGGPSWFPVGAAGKTSYLLGHVDGALAESWMRGNGDAATAWPTEAVWQQHVQLLIDAHNRNFWMGCTVNINNATAGGTGFVPANFTAAQVDQWRRFTACSFLIGNNGHGLFEFVEVASKVPWTETHPYYDVQLGPPLDTWTIAQLDNPGAAFQNGCYVRRFEGGAVYVNVSAAPVSFPGDRPYKNIDNSAIAGNTITVPAHDGKIVYTTVSVPGGGTGIKKPIQGVVRAGAVNIQTQYIDSIEAISVYPEWKNMQVWNSGAQPNALSGPDVTMIDNAIAWCKTNGKQLKIRLFVGAASGSGGGVAGYPPGLALLTGTFMNKDAQDPGSATAICKYWTTAFLTAYDKLMELIAARWDATPEFHDITISGPMTRYAEPFIKGFSVPQNRAELVGGGVGWGAVNITAGVGGTNAGYTMAKDKTAWKAFIDSHAKWLKKTPSSLSFNPYQILLSKEESAAAGFPDTYANNSDDQHWDANDVTGIPNTLEIMDYFKAKLGDRGVLENNSIRESFFVYGTGANINKAIGLNPTGNYTPMYKAMIAYGPPSFYQTGHKTPTSDLIGDFARTMSGAVNVLKTNAVEPPSNYLSLWQSADPDAAEYAPTEMALWNGALIANPFGGGGGGGGTNTETLTSQFKDTYSRTVAAGGLGTSDSGHTYTLKGTPLTDFSVDGARAVVNAPLTTGRIVTVNGYSDTDVEVVGTFSIAELAVGGNEAYYVWIRGDTVNNNGYRLRILYSPTNALQAMMQSIVLGVTTSLPNAGLTTVPSVTLTPTSMISYKFRVKGTHLSAKVWLAGGTEPTAWLFESDDTTASLQVAGNVAWQAFVETGNTNAPVNYFTEYFEAFKITDTSTPPPTNNPPTVAFNSPADASSVQASGATGNATIPVVAVAADGDPGDSVNRVTVKVNNGVEQLLSFSSVTNTWDKQLVLPVGTYTLIVTAYDVAGLNTNATRTVTVTPAPVTPPPPPPPTPAPGGGGGTPSPPGFEEWRVEIRDHAGIVMGELKGANVRFGRFVGSDYFMSFELQTTHELAQKIHAHECDFAILRNGVEVVAGEVNDNAKDTDNEYNTISGNGWKTYLETLPMPFDPTKNLAGQNYIAADGTDLTDAVEGLVDFVLSKYDNSIQITFNNQLTGIQQPVHFLASDLASLREMIDSLANQTPGFDWEITPFKELRIFAPRKGKVSDLVLDARTIKGVHWGEQGIKGTTVYGRGQGSGSSQQIVKLSAPTEIRQRFRDRVSIRDYGNVANPAVLEQQTAKGLVEDASQALEFWVTTYPQNGEDVWSRADDGDMIRVVWNDGNIVLDDFYRCVGIESYINAEGDPEVVYNFDITNIGA